MSQPIEDYALIGNTRTAALVSRGGSIDWLCLPRFDSSACFCALLGTADHGRWCLAPQGEVQAIKRYYRDNSLILETRFETDAGEVSVIDFMPVAKGDDRVDLFRMVRGRRGTVAMAMEVLLRCDYGYTVPWVQKAPYGLTAVAGGNALKLTAPVELHSEDFTTRAQFQVRAGETLAFALTWFRSHKPTPQTLDAHSLLLETEAYWHRWANRCEYQGEWQQAVQRSLITLKALTYSPTGGIVAAPTTSLPEALGGERNWDYRYVWIRDATFTLYAMLLAGYVEEARAWRTWLERAVAGLPSQLQIMYGLAGERLLNEVQADWLPGYQNSAPVRLGNAAYRQFQLDVYGELMDAFHLCRLHTIEPDENTWSVQQVLVDFLTDAWQRPDEGIWEVRGPRRHFTHSKVMAWVALDRAIKGTERWDLPGDVERWRELRDRIRGDVLTNGYDHERGSFVQYYGGKTLDASLLVLPLVGFIPATDPRMTRTIEAIQRELTVDGLVRRYTPDDELDGLSGDEGMFLICSFWLADNLALIGRRDEAKALFERLLALRNDVGLLAEEYDPKSKRMLGNFPQALSHVALINTAHNLSRQDAGPAEQRAQH